MRQLLRLSISALAISALASARTAADVINGPYVALPLTNSPDSGIQFTALQDVNMTNFVFYNQGWQDLILCWDATDSVLVEALPTTPGYTEHFFRIDWDLLAGHTYWLTSQLHNNGRYAEFSNFPVANDHLRVDGSIDASRNLRTDIWISFRFLVTVPAPGALTLFAITGFTARRGRRRPLPFAQS